MNLCSKRTIKILLKSQGIRPQKRLGQNFLIDRGAVRRIIEAAEPGSDDMVLEIGPGIGVLTQELARKTKKVMAVEKDKNMVKILKKTLKDFKNVEVVHGDIRCLMWNIKQFKVVGNLPFYLTAPVIRQLLEHSDVARPNLIVLVVQKEVGQRICAKPPRMSLLAVSVQFYSEPKIISYISKKSFWPSPEVGAAIIKIIPNVSRTVLDTLFFKIVKAGFAHPRKQLINNLSKGLKIDKKKIGGWLLKNKIHPTQRAETLTVKDWIKLTKTIEIN